MGSPSPPAPSDARRASTASRNPGGGSAGNGQQHLVGRARQRRHLGPAGLTLEVGQSGGALLAGQQPQGDLGRHLQRSSAQSLIPTVTTIPELVRAACAGRAGPV